MDRKAHRRTLGVVGLVAIVGLGLTACSDGGGDDDETTGTTTRKKPEATTTTALPENPIKVVDQGFSNYDSEGSPRAAYGYVLQNTGDQIIRDIDVDITFYGAGDKVLAQDDDTVEMLRPGEKTGVGDALLTEIVGGPVQRVEVVIPYLEEPVADPSVIPDGAFQVGNIHTEASSLFLETTFSISTTYSTDRIGIPIAFAIYRSSAGKIVGGASTTGLVLPDGTVPAQAKLTAAGIFPDVASTEIYVQPSVIVPEP
jgi:hypothetical protein